MEPIRVLPRKRERTKSVIQTVLLIFIMLYSHGETFGQSNQTQHTLKLDNPKDRYQATLADVTFLVGQWRGEFLGSMAEEVWLPAEGGSILGVFRLFKEDTVRFYEIMTIVEEDEGVSLKLKHFHPDLKGWEEKDEVVTFRLVKASGKTAWFEGLTYEKNDDGTLRGFIAILHKDGTNREHSFTLHPVGKR